MRTALLPVQNAQFFPSNFIIFSDKVKEGRKKERKGREGEREEERKSSFGKYVLDPVLLYSGGLLSASDFYLFILVKDGTDNVE